MSVRRAVVGVTTTGLALVAMGCGSGGSEVTQEAAVAVAAASEAVPNRVSVDQPALIDTDISPADLPVWPGPDPSEFLEPSPPSGRSGVIVGEQAAAAYAAARHNPDALWNIDGIVGWLVVKPLP